MPTITTSNPPVGRCARTTTGCRAYVYQGFYKAKTRYQGASINGSYISGAKRGANASMVCQAMCGRPTCEWDKQQGNVDTGCVVDPPVLMWNYNSSRGWYLKMAEPPNNWRIKRIDCIDNTVTGPASKDKCYIYNATHTATATATWTKDGSRAVDGSHTVRSTDPSLCAVRVFPAITFDLPATTTTAATTTTTDPRLPPTACPCAGWQDCAGGQCIRKPECHLFASDSDIGDPGGTHAQWHTEDNWQNYCGQLGGVRSNEGRCRNVPPYLGVPPDADKLDKLTRCYKRGFLFCSNTWIRDKSNAYCKVEEQPTTATTTTWVFAAAAAFCLRACGGGVVDARRTCPTQGLLWYTRRTWPAPPALRTNRVGSFRCPKQCEVLNFTIYRIIII